VASTVTPGPRRAAGDRWQLRGTRPDLPPGDYLIAAVTRARPDEWEHPAFLARLVANAGRVTIAEGEQHVQDVRVASRR